MTNILYVPQLDANLLSILALNKKRLNVLFYQNGVDILQENTLVAIGFLRGKTHFLQSSQTALKAHTSTSDAQNPNTKHTYLDTVPVAKPITLVKEANYRLWHGRMGHPSSKRLQQFYHFATGVELFSANVTQLSCDICNFTKLTRIVSRDPFTRSSQLLARVHTDIWGPYRTASLGRHLYFILLIDDCTRKSWLAHLKARSRIYPTIRNWIKVTERETSQQVVRFWCDNAKEYQKFMDLIQSDGIQTEFTTPYTPEQNEIAERYNRTIVQMVRSMLT